MHVDFNFLEIVIPKKKRTLEIVIIIMLCLTGLMIVIKISNLLLYIVCAIIVSVLNKIL